MALSYSSVRVGSLDDFIRPVNCSRGSFEAPRRDSLSSDWKRALARSPKPGYSSPSSSLAASDIISRVPRRVEGQVQIDVPDAVDRSGGAFYLPRKDSRRRTGGGGEGHADGRHPRGFDLDVVNEADIVDVDRNLRVEYRTMGGDNILPDGPRCLPGRRSSAASAVACRSSAQVRRRALPERLYRRESHCLPRPRPRPVRFLEPHSRLSLSLVYRRFSNRSSKAKSSSCFNYSVVTGWLLFSSAARRGVPGEGCAFDAHGEFTHSGKDGQFTDTVRYRVETKHRWSLWSWELAE